MTKIRGNEDYLCRAKCVNIFDIVSCKEEQASEILVWLLDPAQGHGLKEYFLKRLLNFLSVGGKIDCFKGKKASSVACKEILKKEILQNIVVQTEVALKNDQRCRNSLAPKDDKCKRVDVFLCANKNRKDAIRKTSFIIGIFIFLTNLQPIPVAPNMSKKSGKTKNIRNINMRPKKNHFSLPPDGRLNCNRNFPKNIGRTTFTFIKPAANGQWI